MLKFILIFILLIGAVFGFPPLRNRVVPHMGPVMKLLGPFGDKISAPSKRWAAKNEMRILLRKLAEDHAEKKDLPSGLNFQSWIRANTRGGAKGLDPWGHPYYLVRAGKLITVGSQGPDRRRNTPDDIRVSVPFD